MPPSHPPLPHEADVLVIGGGVTGAAIFRESASRGHPTLLVDKGDFADGTSQALGMLAWGGLLYMRNLEFGTVRKLCRARDEWIAERPDEVQVAPFQYLPLKKGDPDATLNDFLDHLAAWHCALGEAFCELALLTLDDARINPALEQALFDSAEGFGGADLYFSTFISSAPAMNAKAPAWFAEAMTRVLDSATGCDELVKAWRKTPDHPRERFLQAIDELAQGDARAAALVFDLLGDPA